MTMVNGVSRTTYMPKSIERIEDDRRSSRSGRWPKRHRSGFASDSDFRDIFTLAPFHLWQHIDRKRHRASLSFSLRLIARTIRFRRVFSYILKQTREESLITLVSTESNRQKERENVESKNLKIVRCRENSLEENNTSPPVDGIFLATPIYQP